MADSISPLRKNTLVFAILLMVIGQTFSGYGGSVATPAKLSEIGGADFYALYAAISSVGIILTLPLVGKLNSLFGPSLLATVGVSFQLAMRVLCAVSTGPVFFIISASLSSIGSGLYITLPYAFISDIIPQPLRPRYFGIITACNAFGALVGPLVVGQIVNAGYASVGFIAYAPISIIAVLLFVFLCPKHERKKQHAEVIDIAGILYLITSVCCMVLWLCLGGVALSWTSPASALLLFCGSMTLVLLIRVERKHVNPSIPLYLFKRKRFTTSFLCMFFMTSYSVCSAGFCIFYAQQIMQVSPQISATVTMPQTIMQTLCGIAIGRTLVKRFSQRFRLLAVSAPVLSTLASVLFFTLTPYSSMLTIYTATVFGGIAVAIAQTAFTPFFQIDLEPREYAAAQGMFTFASNSGLCIFSALAGVLLNLNLTYNYVFLLACLFNTSAVIIGFARFRLPQAIAIVEN